MDDKVVSLADIKIYPNYQVKISSWLPSWPSSKPQLKLLFANSLPNSVFVYGLQALHTKLSFSLANY